MGQKNKWVFKGTVNGQLGDKILVLAHAKWIRKKSSKYIPGRTMIASEGGFSLEPMELFLREYSSDISRVGKDQRKSFSELPRIKKKASDLLDSFSRNPRDYILTTAPPHVPTRYFQYTDREFKEVKYYMDPEYRFVQGHSYSIVAVDATSKTVTIANTHDTKEKEYILSYDEFFQYFSDIDMIKFDSEKIHDIDFMKSPYIEGKLNQPLQRTVPVKFNVKEKLSIKLGNKAVISCILQSDGSIYFKYGEGYGRKWRANCKIWRRTYNRKKHLS